MRVQPGPQALCLGWPVGVGDEVIALGSAAAHPITDEDVRKLTDRIEVVYAVASDPEAIPPPLDAVAEA